MGPVHEIFASIFDTAPAAGRLVTDDGFVDIDLPIADYHFDHDGTMLLLARGKINGQTVALAVEYAPQWKCQEINDGSNHFYWGQGQIHTVGSESDAFLAFIANQYGIAHASAKMAPSIPIEIVGIDTDPTNIRTTPIRSKAFFQSEHEEHYAEVFLKPNLPNMFFGFHEKDPGYRHGLLASLSEVR